MPLLNEDLRTGRPSCCLMYCSTKRAFSVPVGRFGLVEVLSGAMGGRYPACRNRTTVPPLMATAGAAPVPNRQTSER